MKAEFINSTKSLTIFLQIGKKASRVVIGSEHPNHTKILAALRKGADSAEIAALCDLKKAVEKKLANAKAEIRDGKVFYDGKELHSTLAYRLMEAVRCGDNPQHVIKFLENLMENPDASSVQEAFDFLKDKGLPITEDGCFLAYKGVRSDYKDRHSGTIDNSVGATPRLKRAAVDPNRRNECSNGLHVGRFEYAKDFACGGPVMLVKVHPRDIVAVPLDHNASKMRVEGYTVVAEHTDEHAITAGITSSDGKSVRTSKTEVEARAAEVAAEYNRNTVVEVAVWEKLFPTKAAARKAGKAACCVKIAQLYLGLITNDEESVD